MSRLKALRPTRVAVAIAVAGALIAGLTSVFAASTSWAFDELHPQVQYSGSWFGRLNANAYAGHVMSSRTANDQVTVNFVGTRLTVLASKDRFSGIAGISVDGGNETKVDLYNSSTVASAPILELTGLAAGPHAITMRVTGQRNPASRFSFVTLDGLIVDTKPGACVEAGPDRVVRGGPHNDVLCGTPRADTLLGGPGDDDLNGGAGNDTVNGEAGDDTLRGGLGTDDCTDDSGSNTREGCEIPAPTGPTAPPGSTGVPGIDPPPAERPSPEPTTPPTSSPGDCHTAGTVNLVGTSGDDILCGTPGADLIEGLGGNDIIYGGGGDDLIDGGPGSDHIFGEAGDDVLAGDSGNDTIEGGPGDDVITGEADDDNLDGGDGTDQCADDEGTNVVVACESPVETPLPTTLPSLPPTRQTAAPDPTISPTMPPTPTPAPTPSITVIEDTDPAVGFTGSWGVRRADGASDGSWRMSRNKSDFAQLTFSGNAISLVSALDRYSGIADILIDGRLVAQVDLYAGTQEYGKVVFESGQLSPGSHTIKVVVSGNRNPRSRYSYVGVDAFIISN